MIASSFLIFIRQMSPIMMAKQLTVVSMFIFESKAHVVIHKHAIHGQFDST